MIREEENARATWRITGTKTAEGKELISHKQRMMLKERETAVQKKEDNNLVGFCERAKAEG